MNFFLGVIDFEYGVIRKVGVWVVFLLYSLCYLSKGVMGRRELWICEVLRRKEEVGGVSVCWVG